MHILARYAQKKKRTESGMSNFSNTLKDNFTLLPNEIYEVMNYKQIGVFSYLASRSTGWDFAADRIAIKIKASYRTVLKILSEIEELEYLTRNKNKNGRMNYILHTPSTIPDSNKINKKTKEPKCKNDRVAKMQGAKSVPISKKNFKVKRNIKQVKTSYLLALDTPLLKTLEPILLEMEEYGLTWSFSTLVEKTQNEYKNLTIKQIAETIIFYWNNVQKKICESDNWHKNGIWISKCLIKKAGLYYQEGEKQINKRTIYQQPETHNKKTPISNDFFSKIAAKTYAKLRQTNG